jgi:membrane-bound lytic murein transglycosylase B
MEVPMRRFISTRRGAALVGGLALAASAVAGGVVSAQTPSPSATATPAARGTPNPQAQQRLDEHLARLAKNLGVDEAKLRDALKQTAIQEVDAAVAAGRLTADQAQQLKDRINSGAGVPLFGGLHGPKGGPGGGMHRGGPGLGADHAALATFLGVTAEQLRTERSTQSLAQVAQNHGKTAAQLKQFLVDQAKQRLAAEVTAGRITQAQADQRLQQFEAGLDQAINAVGKPGPGPRRGPAAAPSGL